MVNSPVFAQTCRLTCCINFSVVTNLQTLVTLAASKLSRCPLQIAQVYKGEKYCNERLCVSVCLSVCEHISKTRCATSPYFCACCMAVAWSSSSGGVAICCIRLLPVLWMTLCLPVIGQVKAALIARILSAIRQGRHVHSNVCITG